MSEENENPKNDNPKSAPPEKGDSYGFSKVWIPVGIAVATLGCGFMYLLSLHNSVKADIDKNARILSDMEHNIAVNRTYINRLYTK